MVLLFFSCKLDFKATNSISKSNLDNKDAASFAVKPSPNINIFCLNIFYKIIINGKKHIYRFELVLL